MNIFKTTSFPNNIRQHSKNYTFSNCVFKFLHIVLALDFGFFRHKSHQFKFTLKLISFLQVATLIILFFSQINYFKIYLYLFWSIVLLTEDLIAILVLSLFKSNKTFCNFHYDLQQIDVVFQDDNSLCYLDIYLVLSILCCLFQRFVITVLYWSTSNNPYDPLWITLFLFVNFSVDIIFICYAYIFYALKCRLGKLLDILENDDFDYVQRLYKSIVDTLEKYKASFDTLFMLLLLFNVPKLMATIFYTLKEMQSGEGMATLWTIILEYCHMLLGFILTIAPALAAEMISTDAEKIKKKLHDKRLLDDNNQKGSILRFISYIEARPCRYHVWKIIPLNADLIGMVLNFCVTYLIVIIQFTHTY